MPKKEVAPVLFDDLDSGRLPRVCVMTGEPATKTIHKTFVNSPLWPIGLFPFSFLGALVGRIAGSDSIDADLPVAPRVRRLSGVTARQERGWLVLRGVHPSFARAVGRLYADRINDSPLQ